MEDKGIIALFWERDERALAEFSAVYQSCCMQIAQSITASPETAEECYNDLCLRLWNSIPPKEPHSLRAYAARIIRNLALQRYEKEHAAKRSAVLVELDTCIGASEEAFGEDDVGTLSAHLNEFLETLSPLEAKVFIRRYFYSEPVGEIARFLGIKENKASKLLAKTRHALRAYLSERGYHIG